jgi:hypothetical protein
MGFNFKWALGYAGSGGNGFHKKGLGNAARGSHIGACAIRDAARRTEKSHDHNRAYDQRNATRLLLL